MSNRIANLPTAPSRQRPSVFSDEADVFLGALPAFQTEANALADEVNTKADAANDSAILAAASEAVVVAASNFKGVYSSLSGALSIPASVKHNDAYWMLLQNSSNVTLDVPGVSAKWNQLPSNSPDVLIGGANKIVSTNVTGDGWIYNTVPGARTLLEIYSKSEVYTKAQTDSSVNGIQTNLNTHSNATSVHSATSAATASRIMMRDSAGRAKVVAPSAADDIARKDTVDTVQTNLNTHSSSAAPHGGHAASAGNTSIAFNVADASTNNHAVNRAFGDSRYTPISHNTASAPHSGHVSTTGNQSIAGVKTMTTAAYTGVRNITISSSNPSGGIDGNIWMKY